MMLRGARGLACAACALLAGCQDQPKQPPTPASAPATRPALTLLVAGSQEWSQVEAVDALAQDRSAVSAAVRLARLAEAAVPWLPDALTDAHVQPLRVMRLSDGLWGFGPADPRRARCLRDALLIGADGAVVAPPAEHGPARLHVSADAEVFPHLLVAPRAVTLAELPLKPALVSDPWQPVWFDFAERRGFGYIALRALDESTVVEAAQYRWQPDEMLFHGPQADALPGGGRFELDLARCGALAPVGGEIPALPRPPGPNAEPDGTPPPPVDLPDIPPA